MKNKKIYIFGTLLLVLNFAVLNNMDPIYFERMASTVCNETSVLKAFRILAYVITALRVFAPAIIIITGIKTGFQSVITEDDAGSKKLARMIIEKFCIAAFIFFIPTIIYAIMSFASGYDKTKSQFTKCGKCLTNISECNKMIK